MKPFRRVFISVALVISLVSLLYFQWRINVINDEAISLDDNELLKLKEYFNVANTSSKLKYCIGQDVESIFEKQVFENTELFLLDIFISDCLFSGNNWHRNKTYKFGMLNSSWNILKDNIMNETFFNDPNCVLSNFNEHCTNIICGTVKLIFTLVTDSNDYWIWHGCSRDGFYRNKFAVVKFTLQPLPLSNHTVLLCPQDTYMYSCHINSAQMVRCNHQLASRFKQTYSDYYNRTSKLSHTHFAWFVRLRNILYALRMLPMLGCGTMLGWYRECGIIPYTQDFDLIVPISQYNEKFEEIFLNHKHFRLRSRYGKPNDSLEYTVLDPLNTPTDIFFLYEQSNYTWYGGIGIGRQKLKSIYPKLTKTCAADFYGFLFHVPCNVVSFIETEYGPNWSKPVHQSNYFWYKSAVNTFVERDYTEKEWTEVRVFF